MHSSQLVRWTVLLFGVTVALPARAAANDANVLLPTLHPRAITQLLESARSKNPFIRANALEVAEHLPGRVVPLVHLGLEDEEPVVRFTALVVVGRLELKEVAALARGLLDDDDASVRAGAMFALRQCGMEVDITPMARMLASKDPQVRSNAAMLLGRMGDASAVPLLKSMAKAPLPRASAVRTALVRIQVAEAILNLGDDSALDAIRAGAYSVYDEIRILAVSIMGQQGDQRMAEAIRGLLHSQPIQIQVAAAASLAVLGQPVGFEVLLAAAESERSTVRSQAAMSLAGYRHERGALQVVAKLLDDQEEQVRLAAAATVLSQRGPAIH